MAEVVVCARCGHTREAHLPVALAQGVGWAWVCPTAAFFGVGAEVHGETSFGKMPPDHGAEPPGGC
jgi:hypothetical protein